MIFLCGYAWPQQPFPCLLSSSDFAFHAVNALIRRRQSISGSLSVGVRTGTLSCTSLSNKLHFGGELASKPWLSVHKKGIFFSVFVALLYLQEPGTRAILQSPCPRDGAAPEHSAMAEIFHFPK